MSVMTKGLMMDALCLGRGTLCLPQDLIASLLSAMQNMQCDKENLEKQLRTVKQERNAFATALRQHGFLGRPGRNHSAAPVPASYCQNKQEQAGLSEAGELTDGHAGSSHAADQPLAEASDISLPQQRSSATWSVQSNTGGKAGVSRGDHAPETQCLRDLTNAVPSPSQTSAAAQGLRHKVISSPLAVDQRACNTSDLQAKLCELRQLAQDLLL